MDDYEIEQRNSDLEISEVERRADVGRDDMSVSEKKSFALFHVVCNRGKLW